jgi:hypothetical protein
MQLFFYEIQTLTILFRIIFELIKGEMAYVKDLENIEVVR